MIELSNGHRFEYMAASGALAFDGRGWPWEWPLRWCGLLDPRCFTIVTKSLSRYPREGHLRWWKPWSCVRTIKNGAVNAVGLTNPGIEWWCRTIGPRVDAMPYKLVGSLVSERADEFGVMAEALDPFPLVGIELNCSCPNSGSDAMGGSDAVIASVEAALAATRHPLLVKLAITHDYVAIAKALEGKVAALSINTIPWKMIFPHRESPLYRLGGGGVSGRAAQGYTWRMVRELAENTTTPVIGPGVWEYGDIARLRALGAKAISFGSIFLRYPWRPTQYVKRCQSTSGQK